MGFLKEIRERNRRIEQGSREGIIRGKTKDEPCSNVNWDELKERYFKVHTEYKGFFKKITSFPAVDFLVEIENERYYLSEIINLNIEKDWGTIYKDLLGDKKEKRKTNMVNIKRKFIPVLCSPKTKAEIVSNLKLPYQ